MSWKKLLVNPSGRIQSCGPVDARKLLAKARAFLEVAELCSSETDQDLEMGNVAGSLAVLAGIAASDAACCQALGQRSRSATHSNAATLLEQIGYDGKSAAVNLRRLLAVKDGAQYGIITLSAAKLKGAIRQARSMVEFAEDTTRR